MRVNDICEATFVDKIKHLLELGQSEIGRKLEHSNDYRILRTDIWGLRDRRLRVHF